MYLPSQKIMDEMIPKDLQSCSPSSQDEQRPFEDSLSEISPKNFIANPQNSYISMKYSANDTEQISYLSR